MSLAVRVGVLSVLGGAAGCGSSPGGPPLPPGFSGFDDDRVRTSAHFRYHAHADDTSVCDATLDELETHFAAIAGALPFDWPAGRVVDYYKFRSPGELTATAICPVQGSACAANGVVFAPELINQHELVHGYLAAVGRPPLFVEEGIAVALSCDPTQFSGDVRAAALAVDGPALAAWSDDPAVTPPLYAAAATLVRWLWDARGAGAFVAYYAAGKRGPFADVDADFRAAFGLGIDAALAMARAAPGGDDFCRNVYACGAPAVSLGGAATTVGERCGVSVTYRALALAQAQTIALALRGGGSLQLLPCDGSARAPAAVTVGRNAGGGGGTLIVALAAGSYVARHTGTPVVSQATVSAAAVPPAWFGPACDPAAGGAYPFDDSPNELALAAPRGSGPWTARFSVAAESALYLTTEGLAADLATQPLALCPSCADLAAAGNPACQLVSSSAAPVMVAGERALAISTDDARDAFAVVQLARIPPARP